MAATQQRCADGQRVILAVHTLNRLARHSRELIRLATAIRTAGLCLHVLTGPLCGIHDAETEESAFFEILAVAARLDHEYVAEKSKAGARAASAAGVPAGRPRVLDQDMLTLARGLTSRQGHRAGKPVRPWTHHLGPPGYLGYSGGTSGFRSMLGIKITDRHAAVVLANEAGAQGLAAAVRAVLDNDARWRDFSA